ncbi:type I-B CRISPR-associated protein Cas5b [Kosmotoga sp. DU53]|uniref:type I-B CRISPR-associated protein Cas5b n=1 Tax=Kosmotoga sp. DU53 TaxID=1310160 RepID=UPI0007C57B17|nr:type I-B CRISPR-associated protein Cas5b [Kosmotoga sp. DU53]
MKVLVLDISSDYAHFRKPYTTTSALTYSIPPRTAVLGIIGSILGISSGGFGKSEHSKFFETNNVKTGVRLLTSIKKTTFNLKYLHTKNGGSILVPVECVVSPIYRIYVSGNEDFLAKLESVVKNKECYYTPYLGISEFLASVSYVGFFEGKHVDEIPTLVDSVIYLFDKGEIKFESGLNLFHETHAVRMDCERKVQEYSEIVYEENGKKIQLLRKSEKTSVISLVIGEQKEVIMLV